MKTLILGGVRTGKSRLAEWLARRGGRHLVYAATGIAIEVPPAGRTRLRLPVGEGRPSLMFHGDPESCGVPF